MQNEKFIKNLQLLKDYAYTNANDAFADYLSIEPNSDDDTMLRDIIEQNRTIIRLSEELISLLQ